ncbi:acyl-protein synthetase [Clostridium cellulovorans]|uniref:Acyl-protein synthetase, LuxE n=1 Tax=Clostridium cellulovorans (strain ATCC 35296 / DSM 3052 / OCM 3 / 743B) TaxID=573061 RepID=D9SMI7_CLOC7|nr:acyl-protein synthetase [Clostridium cellulovorans]ADL53843.1 acyl-protein synthetase, LuxE [Clostridium cellulovorans 743B]
MNNFFQDLKENVINQYKQCQAYKLLCDSQGFNPSINLNTEKDIENIPFIATTLFKKSADIFKHLLRVPVETIEKWTVSSSTSGDPSMVGRRRQELMQIGEINERDKEITRPYIVQECVFYPEPEVMRKHKSEMILGRPTESYMGNLLDLFEFKEGTIFLVKEEDEDLTIDIDKFKNFIIKHDQLEEHLAIRGSTLLIFNAIKELEETMRPVKLGKNVLVHTGGGGWEGKKGNISTGIAITRQEFVETVASFLGIPEENFIDGYSFTENTCGILGHYSKEYKDYLFHVPKWGKVIIRDIKTLKPLYNPGDRGFVQILNAYGTDSFAGASILVDDIAEIVSMDQCPDCNKYAMTIKVIGRVKGAEAKGCGATLNVRSEI